ncbi:MAG: tRNA lysidine(34) synthetase TilS [Legionellaceae bacterium]|nr:tRNA lysidine(34) synthetase TilS [Legionellaceae bacterium]
MHEQSELVSLHWVERLVSYKIIRVGFSGGLDSTVLLHQLACIPELTGKLSAVHVHHGLSVNADAWQTHCEHFCGTLGVPLIVSSVKLDPSSNIEERARLARYGVFELLSEENDCLLLGHHCNDQAETLLLHLLRGTGIDGLAAMPEIRALAKGKGDLIRPFLSVTRDALEHYAKAHQLQWIDDESNQNLDYSRNFIRHHVLPLMGKKWPNVVKNLAGCANHCQAAKVNLDALAVIDCPELSDADFPSDILPLDALPLHDENRLINVLRVWLKRNNMQSPGSKLFDRLIHDVIYSKVDSIASVSWSGVIIRRYQRRLYLLKGNMINMLENRIWSDFPASISLSDQMHLSAEPSAHGIWIPEKSCVEVRFRQGGEMFQWHGQTKTLKKLLQEWGVPPWQRNRIPLIYVDNCLKTVVGFAKASQEKPLDRKDKKFTFHLRNVTARRVLLTLGERSDLSSGSR